VRQVILLFRKGGLGSGNFSHKGRPEQVGGSSSLSDPETDRIMGVIVQHASPWRHAPATEQQWEADFGRPAHAMTPIGEVKLGDNQLDKLIHRQRADLVGLVKPTLESPTFIIEKLEHASGKDRDSKLIFVRAFFRPDKSLLCFSSVSVLQGNIEVVISNHREEIRRIVKWVRNEELRYSVPAYAGSAKPEPEQPLEKSFGGIPDGFILRYVTPEIKWSSSKSNVRNQQKPRESPAFSA
jgi:hypothetical protein